MNLVLQTWRCWTDPPWGLEESCLQPRIRKNIHITQHPLFSFPALMGGAWGDQKLVQSCSAGRVIPLLALTPLTCFTLGGFLVASEHVGCDAFSSTIQTRSKWHNPGWKEPCVFFYMQLLLCFQTRLSSFLFLYSNFAHTNVKQQLFGQHFEKQLVILAALILKLGLPLHTVKKASFSFLVAADIFTYFLCKCEPWKQSDLIRHERLWGLPL